jgi:uncharacterized protein (TIGR03067 family)
MSISFVCPCGKKLKVSETLAGKKVKCPDCKEVSLVTANGAEEPAESLASAEVAVKPAKKKIRSDADLAESYTDSEEAAPSVAKKKIKATEEEEEAGATSITTKKKPAKHLDEDEEEAPPAKTKKGKKAVDTKGEAEDAPKSRKKLVIAVLLLLVLGGSGGAFWYFDVYKMLFPAPPQPPPIIDGTKPVDPGAVVPFEAFPSDPGGFNAKLPGRQNIPRWVRDVDPLPPYRVYQGNSAGVHYRIAFDDVPGPPPASYSQAEERLKKRCEDIIKYTEKTAEKAGGTAVAGKVELDESLGKYPGRQLEITLPNDTLERHKVFVVEERIYDLSVKGPTAMVNAKEALEFFKHFTLHPKLMEMELKMIEGIWQVGEVLEENKSLDLEKFAKEITIDRNLLKGEVIAMILTRQYPKAEKTEDGKVNGLDTEMKIRIEPAKKPKSVDFTFTKDDKEVVLKGIYSLENGEFKICFGKLSEQGVSERPTDFNPAPPEEKEVILIRARRPMKTPTP